MQNRQHSMYYISLVCPDPPAGTIRAYQGWMYDHFGCRAAMKSPPHITLVPPFWLPEEKEASLNQVLSGFSPDQDAIEIACNGFNHFGKRVLYVQVEKNRCLHRLESLLFRRLAIAFESVASQKRESFHPHITLATRDIPPAAFQNAWEYFSKKAFSVKFEAAAISLMKLGQGKWHITDAFPLRDQVYDVARGST